jgi:hypothetical protein
MRLPIHFDCYSGFKANERPREFILDEELYEIAAVLDQWYEPSATYFKVQSTEGKTYLLCSFLARCIIARCAIRTSQRSYHPDKTSSAPHPKTFMQIARTRLSE